MPTVQSTYSDNIAAGYAGAIANQEHKVLISRTVEDAAGIGFGLAVMQGTEDKGCVIGDGTDFLGVTVREQDTDPADPDVFAQYDSARIATKGVIWIANSGGVSAGDPVSLLPAGALGTGGSVEVANARWDTTAADGELAQLRLA
jgi:hypothetical protein